MSTIDSAETVIVGAGIVGCSIAYHLAQRGYDDAIVIDRGTLATPLGSTGHAPGLLAQISPSPVMTELARYSAELYAKVPTNNPAYRAVGSIEVTRDPANLRRFRDKIQRGQATGIRAEALSSDEIKRRVPFMNVDNLAGGVLVPSDGVLDANRALKGLAEHAQAAGISFQENTVVSNIENRNGKVVAVVTDKGRIECRRVVVAVGIWGAELMKCLALEIPLFPVQHPYVYTAALKELADAMPEMNYPLIRDIDNVTYFRQHGTGMGYGWYNHTPMSANMVGLGGADIPYRKTDFEETLELGLFPFLRNARVKRRLNGIFSMTPDGGPLLGEIGSISGVWLAQAVWVTHAGGVGKLMSELLLGHEASVDVTNLDANRFHGVESQMLKERALCLYNNIYDWPV